MTQKQLERLRTHNKQFVSHLMSTFGLKLSDLNEAAINAIEEPRRTWLRWGLEGFDRAETTYSCIAQYVPGLSGRHLDVGCGTGYLCATFAKHGFESVGIDICDLTHARLQYLDFPDGRLTFSNIDLLKDDSASLGTFDVITLDNTIEHIELPSVMISRLQSLLAKDGVIYLIIPNSHWIDCVRSDPHYRQFGISLLDKHDGDALLAAMTDDQRSYDVNNWFCRYRFDHYAAMFRRYGFSPTVYYHGNPVDDGVIEREVLKFDLAAVESEFRSKLMSMEAELSTLLFPKLKHVIDIYLAELANDYELATQSSVDMIKHYRFGFAETYLLASWFVLLRKTAPSLDTPKADTPTNPERPTYWQRFKRRLLREWYARLARQPEPQQCGERVLACSRYQHLTRIFPPFRPPRVRAGCSRRRLRLALRSGRRISAARRDWIEIRPRALWPAQ